MKISVAAPGPPPARRADVQAASSEGQRRYGGVLPDPRRVRRAGKGHAVSPDEVELLTVDRDDVPPQQHVAFEPDEHVVHRDR